jgi:hypothetical protein
VAKKLHHSAKMADKIPETKAFSGADDCNDEQDSQRCCRIPSLLDKVHTVCSIMDPFRGLDLSSEIDLQGLDEANLFPAMVSRPGHNHLEFLDFERPPGCVNMAVDASKVAPSAPEVFSPEVFFASLRESAEQLQAEDTTCEGEYNTFEFISTHSAIVSWQCRHHPDSKEDSIQVWLRPLVGSDSATLSEGLTKLSDRSRFYRFLRPIKSMSVAQASRCCELDYEIHFAFGLSVKCGDKWLGVGVGSFVKERPDPTRAEVAITINDGWQGLGLASLLGYATAQAAYSRGVTTLTGIHHAENSPLARHLVTSAASGVRVSTAPCSSDRGVTEILVALPMKLAPDSLPLSREDFDLVTAAASGQARQKVGGVV